MFETAAALVNHKSKKKAPARTRIGSECRQHTEGYEMTYYPSEDPRAQEAVSRLTAAVFAAWMEGREAGFHVLGRDNDEQLAKASAVAASTQTAAQQAIYDLATQLHAEAVA